MKSKLNEADEFFLLNNSYTVDEFVEKLKVNKDIVEKFLFNNKERILVEPTMLEWDELKQLWRNPKTGEYCVGPVVEKTDTKQTVETKQKIASGLTAGDLMARNERYGAIVMTPGASEMGDHARQHKKRELDGTKIHRPKPKK